MFEILLFAKISSCEMSKKFFKENKFSPQVLNFCTPRDVKDFGTTLIVETFAISQNFAVFVKVYLQNRNEFRKSIWRNFAKFFIH